MAYGEAIQGLLGNPQFMMGLGLLSGNPTGQGFQQGLQGFLAANQVQSRKQELDIQKELAEYRKNVAGYQADAAGRLQAQDTRDQYTRDMIGAASSVPPQHKEEWMEGMPMRGLIGSQGNPEIGAAAGLIGPVPGSENMFAPTLMENAAGDLVYGQAGNKGSFQPLQLPEGMKPAPGLEKTDTGDEIIFTDRTGTVVARQKKSLAPDQTSSHAYDLAQQGKWGEYDALFAQKMQQDVPGMIDSHNKSKELMAGIKAGDTKTGVVVGNIMKFFDPKTAALHFQSVWQVLQNLQITKLTPVSNDEVKLVQGLYAAVDRTGEVNIELLNQSMEMVENKLNTIRHQVRHFQDRGTMQNYIPPGLFQDVGDYGGADAAAERILTE